MSDDDCDDDSNLELWIIMMSIIGVSIVGILIIACFGCRCNCRNDEEVNDNRELNNV
jgi:hypothetical protein